jgi:hypothetical protein
LRSVLGLRRLFDQTMAVAFMAGVLILSARGASIAVLMSCLVSVLYGTNDLGESSFTALVALLIGE